MIKNYLKTAFRNLFRTKLFSLINILGLAIGMAAFLFIMLYVQYQRSYDKFNTNAERIYRLRYERTDADGQAVRFASCCPPGGLLVRESLPEVEKVARLFRLMATVSHGEKNFYEERMYFAEQEFFQLFDFKFIHGDKFTGIKEPNKAFISKSAALKYFGSKNPVGEYISVDRKTDYKIEGVFEDIPENSHLKFDILLSYQNLLMRFGQDVEQSWGDSGWFTYLLFKPGADIKAFNRKLTKLLDDGINQDFKAYNLRVDLKLQPLISIHLNSNYQQEYEVNGNADTVSFLSIIAYLIILIAWVNYINLSTAHSLSRAKEVGLRKTVGASRLQIMVQFFIETIIINIAALLITFCLILLLHPAFCNLTNTSPNYGLWSHGWFWMYSMILFFAGIFLSGLYPVLLLSSFKPAEVLKGKFGAAKKGFNFRKILVLGQFTLAIALITCTLAVLNQLNFMKSQNLGFDKEQIIVLRAPRVRDAGFAGKLSTFKEQLLTNPVFSSFSVVTEVPGKQILWDAGGIHRVGTENNKNYQIVGVDYDFAELFKLKFTAGRNFSKDFPSDTSALLLNEMAAVWLGFRSPEEAVNQQVIYWGKTYNVVGILKNYHQQSLKNEFEPHIYRLMPTGRDLRACFTVKLSATDNTAAIAELQKQYTSFFPGNPFEYFFLDEYFNRQYKADELFGTVFGIFSFLAIFITCIGVLGLSYYVVTQRTKEIGVRKVLGAGVSQIVFLFIKEYLLLIILAFIIAAPVAYYAIISWLESFAVKMQPSLIMFLIPLLIVASVTVFTICSHTIKAAFANPVNSLRYE